MDAMLPEPAKEGGVASMVVASLEMSPAVIPSRVDTNSATGFLRNQKAWRWAKG